MDLKDLAHYNEWENSENVGNNTWFSVCLRNNLHILNFTHGVRAVGLWQPYENTNKCDLGSSDNISVLV